MYTLQYLQLNVLKESFTSNSTACPLEIIGFPCNQFGLQEPGENEYEIMNGLKYVRPGNGYTPNFPLVEKRDVNGEKQDDIFTYLKSRCPSPDGYIDDLKSISWSPVRNDDVSWNFEKFLIDHTGQPFRRYSSPVEPKELTEDIKLLIEKCKRSLKVDDRFNNQLYWY